MRISFFRRSVPSLEKTLAKLSQSAFFSPTPWAIARKMLEMAQLRSNDVLYDLGSGDGRIPIMAAQEFGCRAVGIELDEKLCRLARGKVAEYGLQERVSFHQEDFFKSELRDASVVTLYLLTQVNGYLGPRLASQLAQGARVVCLDYPVPGWRAEKDEPARSEGNVDYTIYLYRR
jgi:16S rRNA A1518/A1519 N6-dimethyltransferase RsmA/KsgA/DIM1 with predicted DNA glycosylase/AP lyase activity